MKTTYPRGAADTEQHTLFTFSDTLQNGARVTRRRQIVKQSYFIFVSVQKVFSYLSKITVEPLTSHGLFYWSPCYVSGRWSCLLHCCLWEGQRTLRMHQKYLNLCSEDEQRSYRFGTAWGWVINNRTFIFGWTIPVSIYIYIYIYIYLYFIF